MTKELNEFFNHRGSVCLIYLLLISWFIVWLYWQIYWIFYGMIEDTELLNNVFDIIELEEFPRPVLDTTKLFYPVNLENCECEERLVISKY